MSSVEVRCPYCRPHPKMIENSYGESVGPCEVVTWPNQGSSGASWNAILQIQKLKPFRPISGSSLLLDADICAATTALPAYRHRMLAAMINRRRVGFHAFLPLLWTCADLEGDVDLTHRFVDSAGLRRSFEAVREQVGLQRK